MQITLIRDSSGCQHIFLPKSNQKPSNVDNATDQDGTIVFYGNPDAVSKAKQEILKIVKQHQQQSQPPQTKKK